ncbi:response regulator [Paracoccus sp. (in: a-proteobacteria)]|uniref:response regulator n=1 Tax=Paracoccus sp. TaxID=267 RepID=UPI00396C3CDE
MTGNGLRILVVEDDFLVAHKLANDIRARGDQVVGPFADASEAIDQMGLVQAAILDVRLRDETSFLVADSLVNRGIPFVFLTGYDRRHIPARFHGQGIFAKPAIADPLLDSLHHEHVRATADDADDIEAAVVRMLQQARRMMPDEASAERLVEGVLHRAIAAADNNGPEQSTAPWLMMMLHKEYAQRGRLYLN